MKKIISISVSILFAVIINAQTPIIEGIESERIKEENLSKGMLKNEEYFEKADYILEVKRIPNIIHDYYGSKISAITEDELYKSWSLKVLYVYKGDYVQIGDTIVAFAKARAGVITREFSHPDYPNSTLYEEIGTYPGPTDDPGLSMLGDHPIIIFGLDTEFPASFDQSKNDKYLKIKVQDKERAALKLRSKITGLNGLSFKNRSELYEYMKQFKGLDIPKVPEGYNGKLDRDEIMEAFRVTDTLHNENKLLEQQKRKEDWNNYNDRLHQKLEIMLKNKENKKKLKSSESLSDYKLTVGISNQQVTAGNGKYYFEFDVNISSNTELIYLDNVLMHLNYNTAAFGENISANNITVATLNSIFDTITYEYFMEDISSSCIVLGVGTKYIPNLSRTRLNTIPTNLAHIKIELNNNSTGKEAGITFINTETTSIFSWFSISSNSNILDAEFFNNTEYINPTSFLITTQQSNISFTPATILAGTDDILTIRGTNFGTQRGKVIFTAAESPTVTNNGFLKGLDEQYYVKDGWTNTEIKVKVPSFVQDEYYDGNLRQPGYGSSAGTGPIKIITANNDTIISENSLIIEYSITNYKADFNPDTPIERVYLARQTCDHDFMFYLHENMRDSIDAIIATEAALAEWRKVTGLNLQLVKNGNNYVYQNSFPAIGQNVIGYESMNSGLMATAGRYSKDNTSNKFYRITGSNIKIQPVPDTGYTWNYSTTQPASRTEVSFYNSILHELGHILLLAHINNDKKLMHPTETINIVNPIIDLSNETSVLSCVNNTITASKNIVWGAPLTTLADSIPTPIITSDTGNFTICNNNPIILSVQNTNGSYSYQWVKDSDNIISTNSTAYVSISGEYYVQVNNGKCNINSTPLTIVSSNLNATFTLTDPVCRGTNEGAITTYVTGNNPPFSYEWTNNNMNPKATANLTGLRAGEYRLVLTDNAGCFETYFKQVSEPDVFNGTIRHSGIYAYADITGGTKPYSYIWQTDDRCSCPLTKEYVNSGHIPNINCNYSVTVTDQCKGNLELSSSGRASILLSANITIDEERMFFKAITSGGTPPYSYQWELVNSSPRPVMCLEIPNQFINSPEIPASLVSGNCVPKVIVTDFCGNLTEAIFSTGKSIKHLAGIEIYPNPTTGNFKILNVNNAEIYLYTALSEHVQTFVNVNESADIDISRLSNGIYILRIIDGDNTVTKRIVLNK